MLREDYRKYELLEMGNTHDWCDDKPYEWDLQTSEGKTFVATNRQEFFCTESSDSFLLFFPKNRKEDVMRKNMSLTQLRNRRNFLFSTG